MSRPCKRQLDLKEGSPHKKRRTIQHHKKLCTHTTKSIPIMGCSTMAVTPLVHRHLPAHPEQVAPSSCAPSRSKKGQQPIPDPLSPALSSRLTASAYVLPSFPELPAILNKTHGSSQAGLPCSQKVIAHTISADPAHVLPPWFWRKFFASGFLPSY